MDLLVKGNKMRPHSKRHDNRQPKAGYTDCVRFAILVYVLSITNARLDARLTLGPHILGHTYDPAILPSCEKALMNARATARLAGGRGIELETQESRTTSPA